MRVLAIIVFILLSNIMNSQNSNNVYSSVIEIIKNSSEFNSFLAGYSSKEKDFAVSEITYPICPFYSEFEEFLVPCKSDKWSEIWPKEQIENLDLLGNKKNKKVIVGITNTENLYLVSELSIKSKNKSLIYLFQLKDDKPILIKVKITTLNK